MIVAELRNVTKRFGSVTALEGVDVSIKRGQVLALLGPNGAGKTTAVRLILGLSYPGSGEVRLFGRDPHELEARRRIGVMLQLGRVPETLRVRDHVQLFSSYYPHPMPFSEVIAAAGLEGLERRMFSKLSGASVSAFYSPSPSAAIRNCSCSTNPQHRSTLRAGAVYGATSVPLWHVEAASC